MRGIQLLVCGFIFFFFSCNSNKKELVKTQITRTQKSKTMANQPPGAMVYLQFCLACHMENGEGVPGLYPPIVQTEFVLGEKKKLIDAVINGMEGLVEVKGQQYNNVMAKMDYLSDEQIAEVLTYVRSNFGNNAEVVTINDVKMARSALVN